MLGTAFASHSRQGGSLTVTTFAGRTLTLNDDEIRRGGETADLVQLRTDLDATDELARAKLLFSIMAKACEDDCRRGGDTCSGGEANRVCSFEQGLSDLDRSLNWRVPPDLLGMREDEQWRALQGWRVGRWFRVTRFVRGGHACVAATRGHTFFVGDGWADKYGRPVSFNSKFGSWFAFKGAQVYCLGLEESHIEQSDEAAAPPMGVEQDSELATMQ
jgi:hypothetical protein